jgi:2-polyprenyl-3-methyl-5-hydroxy-6-metoxy-1,4-benzoquinol methylase
MSAADEHWETIYRSRSSTEVSWFQRSPRTSVQLIESAASSHSAAVIDVGGGASLLVDRLAERGFTDLTVLDLSDHALDEVRRRLATKAAAISFVHHDVLTWSADRLYDVWHDRAVFHFLTESDDKDRYVEQVHRALHEGATAIVGTFAEDGPTHCSGLPVSRYSPEQLDSAFDGAFTAVRHEREEHITPNGVMQPFTWVVLRRA